MHALVCGQSFAANLTIDAIAGDAALFSSGVHASPLPPTTLAPNTLNLSPTRMRRRLISIIRCASVVSTMHIND
jgi:hypothetical protein